MLPWNNKLLKTCFILMAVFVKQIFYFIHFFSLSVRLIENTLSKLVINNMWAKFIQKCFSWRKKLFKRSWSHFVLNSIKINLFFSNGHKKWLKFKQIDWPSNLNWFLLFFIGKKNFLPKISNLVTIQTLVWTLT